MSATTLSPARALRRPRRLAGRALFGIFLLLLATGGSITFWSTSSETRSLLVAARDVPAGSELTASDLAVARVRVDEAIYRAAVPASELSGLLGKQLVEPLHAQQILVRAQISSRPRLGPEEMGLTIPISPESAAGGSLRAGDLVQVFLTTNKGKPEARTTVVLPQATVYEVGHDRRATVVNTELADRAGNQGEAKWLTLVVTQEQALQLAQARWAGELDVALLPPR